MPGSRSPNKTNINFLHYIVAHLLIQTECFKNSHKDQTHRKDGQNKKALETAHLGPLDHNSHDDLHKNNSNCLSGVLPSQTSEKYQSHKD
mmetsp:Transcript_7276/g.15226  ORF Transcript_7276/g.15226 Transcript_7276/m.15226 type:complete len:90 (+) Transcript_7276:239-508(+)